MFCSYFCNNLSSLVLLDWAQIGSGLVCPSFLELLGGEYDGFVGHPEAATMFWNFDLLQVRL
jgi:hypothetical protein